MCSTCGYTVPQRLRLLGLTLTFIGWRHDPRLPSGFDEVAIWLCPKCYEEKS